mgnify:CR=1 FL=1
MKVTKANIVKAVEKATGIKPEIEKHEGSYYWLGKEASLFSDCCVYVSALNHPKATIELFVESFKEKIAEVEAEYSEPIADTVKNIDWKVDFEIN